MISLTVHPTTQLTMTNPSRWPYLLRSILLGLILSAWAGGCLSEPEPPDLTNVNPLAGQETAETCRSRGMRFVAGECKSSADLMPTTCTPACSVGETCYQGQCVLTDRRTAKEKCEADHPGRTCTDQGEVEAPITLAETPTLDGTGSTTTTTLSPVQPDQTCEPGQTQNPACGGGAGTDTQTTETTPTAAQHVIQPVPTDAEGVFTQLPASITQLSATDFTALAGRSPAGEAAGCDDQSSTPEPTSGAAPHKSKGGEPTQPPRDQPTAGGATPEQPTVSELESPGACPDSQQATSSSPVPAHLCLDPAYQQATLLAADGTAETFHLVNFGTTAYLSYAAAATSTAGAITVKKGPYTLIEHTLLKIQPQYLIHGLNADDSQAVMHHQPTAILDTYVLATTQNQATLQANLNLTAAQDSAQAELTPAAATTPATPTTLTLGSYQHAAITLFAFGPWTSIEQASLLRNFFKDNSVKVDLAAQGHCVGIYANATKTKFPVVLLTAPAEPRQPNIATP